MATNQVRKEWQWAGIPESAGIYLWNHYTYKKEGELRIDTVVIRSGQSEWCFYRVK